MRVPLMRLALRRSLWPALLVGCLAVGWVLWNNRVGAASELTTWSRSPGVLRHAVWMTGILVSGPLLLGRAAAIGHRLAGADAPWCASRPASRLGVLCSSWIGALTAACVLMILLAAAAELGVGTQVSRALQPIGPAELTSLETSESGIVSFELEEPAHENAAVLRLPVGLIATGGPSARIRARLMRTAGGAFVERELIVATTRPIELDLPAGEGPLRLELERVEDGALVLVPAKRAGWWRVMRHPAIASLFLACLGFLVCAALLAWALALGVWMRPAPATALLLAVAIALWFSGGTLGGWGVAMEHIAGGDIPALPTLLGSGLAMAMTAAGGCLGWWGLRWGARS